TKANVLMRKLQPELKAIQDKYKSNPQKLNEEMLALYKRHGANPLGGCLPMLLQIPVFFALFTALRNSWDLHGAPFVLWIRDLSYKDPYYVLPLTMGAIMFLQQRRSAMPGMDPTQQMMMQWMPLIFTFMFLNFPSGLVLYWLLGSVVGFFVQIELQKKYA
ncbi:MAG TPA: membrane protein insertase YidC, partial [Elusimicrobiales bacterium]|nr:membrane protein insertase YidC [Elusimicrobiales bacterium]